MQKYRTLIVSLIALVAVGGAAYIFWPKPQTFTVYFVRDEGVTFSLQPVSRKAVFHNPVELAQHQIDALIAGPAESEIGLSTTIPSTAVPIAIGFGAEELTVDFPSALGEGGGTSMMFGRLHQLHYTLTETAEVNNVLLFIDGERIDTFSTEGIIIENPWQRSEHDALPRW